MSLRKWYEPVALYARATLRTINHDLLSIEAPRARGVPLLGIVFIGEENREIRADHRRNG
jgi:dethiobiotin synthetase